MRGEVRVWRGGNADGWAERLPRAPGPIRANQTRFPSGMKKLADFVHEKGLNPLFLLPLPCVPEHIERSCMLSSSTCEIMAVTACKLAFEALDC